MTVTGRGHWLIGGRAIDLVVSEMERFLMRTLGADLRIN